MATASAPAAAAALPNQYQGVNKASFGFKMLATMGWKEGQGLVSVFGLHCICIAARARAAAAAVAVRSLLTPLATAPNKSTNRAPTSRASRRTSRSRRSRTRLAWAR